MNSIKSFSDLINHLNERESRKRIVVVWAADDHTTQACARALDCGFADFIFVGCKQYVESQLHGHADGAHVKFVDAESPVDAAVKAVAMVRNDEADALMKGLINTDDLLHAVLNKQTGILPSGKVLTHITIADIPQYDRLLLFSDPAVIPYPTQEQRIEQIKYMQQYAKRWASLNTKFRSYTAPRRPTPRYSPSPLIMLQSRRWLVKENLAM